MIKKLLYLGVFSIILVIAVIYFAAENIIGYVTVKGVEKFAPDILKTDVQLDEVNISLFKGKGTIKDFVVGNPDGFNADKSIRINEAEIDIDVGTLMSDVIVIERVYVDGAEFVYERKLTTSNIDVILENIAEATGTEGEEEEIPEPVDDDGEEIKIQINELVFENGKVALAIGGRIVSIPLPNISINDIGKKEGGVTPQKAAYKIMAVVLKQVSKSAVSEIGGAPVDAVKNTVNGIGKEIKGIFKKKNK